MQLNPEKYKGFQGPFGTDSAYHRWYHRELAGLDVPKDVKVKNMFGVDFSNEHLKKACVESKMGY